ncbi:MAG: FtsH protease activity modulator HflK [Comamonas sp.]|nr:FtsH protease activity modulator HflK [Comamonas sp.]
MSFSNNLPRLAAWPRRLRGMFNLNDPRWGRSEGKDKASDDEQEQQADNSPPPPPPQSPPNGWGNPRGSSGNSGNRGNSSNNGQPPDLDELWRDLNRKLSGLFGQPQRGGGNSNGAGRGGKIPTPDMKGSGIGLGVMAGLAGLIWLGTGFFIVQEGQQAVITQFGRYHSTVGAGFNWRLPYPIQSHELVFVTQIRSVDIGRDIVIKSTGLRESAMLTEDENIVEIKFAVQYRLNDARAWLFESKSPDVAVVQAAESAVREVVGKMKMDIALAEERDQIAPRVRELMQTILDRYHVGVEIVGINMQQGGVRPPEQVQASFDDVLKAGQERERAKNEAQAYANDVVPRASGTASRLMEEAEAYKARIAAQAEGDAQRFSYLLVEYQKAPQVPRDRLYTEAMEQVYSNVTKVLVDSRQGSNLLYLPLDKIMQNAGASSQAAQDVAARLAAPAAATGAAGSPASNASIVDARMRDLGRSREREVR